MIVDAQVHAYEANHPDRPWSGAMPGRGSATGEEVLAAMDAVGVDGALLTSAYGAYGFDSGYVVDVHRAHPDRFAIVTPVDPRREDVADVIAEWANAPGAVGIRLIVPAPARPVDDPGVRRVMHAAARHGIPVCVPCPGRLPMMGPMAAEYPDTQIVVDHLGLAQPPWPSAPPEPWAGLESLLALARHPNVAVKVTGVPTLSREPFPFSDLWGPLGRVFEAFGFDRCMWGSDWTRAVEVVTYGDAVAAFRSTDQLSAGERAALMSGTVQRIFGWSPPRSP